MSYEMGFKPPSATGGTSAAVSFTTTLHDNDFSEFNSLIPVVHLVKAGQYIDVVRVLCRAAVGTIPGTARIGFYETDVTGKTQTNLVVKDLLVNVTDTAVKWNESAPILFDLTPWAGKYIKIAIGPDSGIRRGFVTGASGDAVTNNAAFPANFGAGQNVTALPGMYAVIKDGPGIVSANNGGAIVPGQPATWVTTDFSPAVTRAVLDGVECSNVSAAGFLPPGLVDEMQMPRAGNRVLNGRNATQSANLTKQVAAPQGYAAVEILAGFKTGRDDSIAYQFNPPLQVADLFYNDPTKGTVGSDASYQGNHIGDQLIWHHESATKIVRSFILTTGAGGQVISVRRFFGAVHIAADYFQAKKLKASGF